jgi:hypothetical protein
LALDQQALCDECGVRLPVGIFTESLTFHAGQFGFKRSLERGVANGAAVKGHHGQQHFSQGWIDICLWFVLIAHGSLLFYCLTRQCWLMVLCLMRCPPTGAVQGLHLRRAVQASIHRCATSRRHSPPRQGLGLKQHHVCALGLLPDFYWQVVGA